MLRNFCTVFLSVAALSSICAAPQVVEKRGAVTYSAEDWSHADTRHTVDVGAQPVGGMKAFVSRLDYPASLRQQHVTGVVRVRVSLDAAGYVLSAQIVHSLHPMLDAIVLRAVRQAQWKPAIRRGKSVAWTFTFPVTFMRNA